MSTSITFCGGTRTVTGSMHLIEFEGQRVVIDCGLFQGHREEFYQVNSHFCFNPFQVNTVVLSHSHIDHCGNLPNLVKSGFRGKIFVTKPTKELCQLMLLDSAKIQEEDIKFVNKINLRRNLPLRKPLYTVEDARKSLKSIRALDYYKQFKLTPNISCSFYDAGHILGSATPLLEIKKDSGETLKIAYAVDLGRCNIPLLRDPDILAGVDYLIIESTYGGRLHSPIEDAQTKLAEAINRTASRGGKVIIPSFALERAQELLYIIHELINQKAIPPLFVYLDSPLTERVSEVFSEYPDLLDEETQKTFLQNNKDPFIFTTLRFVETAEESKKLNIKN